MKRKDKKDYGAFISFLVGEGTVRKKGSSVSSDNVKRFNAAVLDLLHEEMYRLVQQLKPMGCHVDDTIRAFQRMYDFSEDELPFENLKRWYYRERIRLEQRASERREVSPQFVLNFFEEVKPAKQTVTTINNNLLFAS